MRRLVKSLVAVLAFALVAQPRDANALLCQAILGCSCTVDATNIAFGTVQPLSGGTATAPGDVSIDCTGVLDVSPSILVKYGAGTYGTTGDRQMQNAAGDRLHYNLYPNSVSSSILGDNTGGFSALTVTGGLLNLLHWTITTHVEARAPMVSTQRAGAYSDTVTVRIDW